MSEHLDRVIADSPIDIEVDGFEIVTDDMYWIDCGDAERLSDALQAAAQKLRTEGHSRRNPVVKAGGSDVTGAVY